MLEIGVLFRYNYEAQQQGVRNMRAVEVAQLAITPHTKGVCQVHMCEQMADTPAIMAIVEEY